jgi:hypothetical protein
MGKTDTISCSRRLDLLKVHNYFIDVFLSYKLTLSDKKKEEFERHASRVYSTKICAATISTYYFKRIFNYFEFLNLKYIIILPYDQYEI